MRSRIVTVGALLFVVLAGTASARPLATPGPVAPVGGGDSPAATATLSSSAAGALSALTLELRGELQCGRPQARTFVIHLPSAMTVPAAMAKSSVLLVGAAPLRVAVASHTVTLTAPVRRGAICDSITQGSFAIAFTRAAGLRNPRSAGAYPFSVAALPGGRWNGTLRVR